MKTSFLEIFQNESLPFGRSHAKKYVWQFLLVFLIGIAASGIAASFSPGKEVHNTMAFISDMLSVFVSSVMTVVSVQIYLDITAGKGVNFNHFKLNTKAKRRMIGKWIWGYVLYTIIVILGLVLCVIPGIYFAIRLSFWPFFLIDQKMSIKDALRTSRDKTKGHVRELIGIWFLGIGATIIGAIALGIGLLRAVPTVKIAFTHLYKKIVA